MPVLGLRLGGTFGSDFMGLGLRLCNAKLFNRHTGKDSPVPDASDRCAFWINQHFLEVLKKILNLYPLYTDG